MITLLYSESFPHDTCTPFNNHINTMASRSDAGTAAPRVNVLFKYREVMRQKLSLDMGMFLPTTNQVH